MSELERWGEHRISGRAGRELRKVDEAAAVEAAIAIRREQIAELAAKQRTESNHAVIRHAMTETAVTDCYATVLSQGKPALEMMLRELQATGLMGDKATVMWFQSRSL